MKTQLLTALLVLVSVLPIPERANHAETLATLEAAIPLGYPVHLRESKSPDDWGWTSWKDSRFVMAIHPKALDEHVIHEYAHLMVWDACTESDHDALWGVAYARAYRAWIGEESE